MLEGLTILIAEDNPTNQIVAVQMLEVLGARVNVASDGVEALAIAEAAAFDVMLVDIEMPRKNGIEVIRALRAPGNRHAETPVIALTAYVMREHREAIDAAGADGVIAKPIVSISEFGQQILDLSARRRGTGGVVACPSQAGSGRTDAPPAAVASPDALDRSALDGLAAAIGADALTEILQQAETDIRGAGRQIVEGLENGRIEDVRAAAHILVGLAGAIGAGQLGEHARTLQEAVRSGRAGETSAAGRLVVREVEDVLAALAGYRSC